MTSSRIVCSRVSSSAVTDGRTNASETCCRSTSTVAAARYRFGSDSAIETAPPATDAKTTSASHLRRLQTPSVRSRFCDEWRVTGSGNDDDVARLDAEIVLPCALRAGARGDLLEVVRQLARRLAVVPDDRDARLRGELAESARHRQHVEDRRPAPELVAPRRLHLADDGDPDAVHFADDHREHRRRHVLLER